jgi:hypothetical protein
VFSEIGRLAVIVHNWFQAEVSANAGINLNTRVSNQSPKKPASVRLVSDHRFAANQTCINEDLPLNRSDLSRSGYRLDEKKTWNHKEEGTLPV